MEIPKKFKISFYKILRNKQYYVKILPKRFRLNGKTIGFRLHIQKLQRQNNLHTTRPTGDKKDRVELEPGPTEIRSFTS